MGSDPAGRYRLAPVRDARTREERGKRSDLAAAVGDARKSSERLDATRIRTKLAREALEAARTARDALIARGSTPAPIALADQFVTRRRRELDRCIGEELRSEATHAEELSEVEVARRTLARARADREVIDRHFAQWREGRRRLAERRDE